MSGGFSNLKLALASWALPTNDPKQALRIRRFFSASITSLLIILALAYANQTGVLTQSVFLISTGLVLGFNFLTFGLLRSGLNLRFRDPSLTAEQILMASGTLFFVAYHAGPARAVFLVVVLLVFLFGVLRLSARKLLVIAVFDAAATFAILIMLPEPPAPASVPKIDLLLFIVVAASLLWLTVMGGYVTELRASTERRNRELADALESLKSREADLAQVQKIAKIGFWSHELGTGRVQWSNEVFRMFGIAFTEMFGDGKPFIDFIHPLDRDRYFQDSDAWRLTGESDEITVRALSQERGLIWIRIQRQCVFGDQGEPRRQFGMVMDVTEAKQAEQRQLMQHSITNILAEYTSLAEAMPAILQVICSTQDWVAAATWRLAPGGEHLRCVETWEIDEPALKEFGSQQKKRQITVGAGLKGMLRDSWQSKKPNWSEDVVASGSYRRREAATAASLRGAFVLPVSVEGEVVRLMEFYSHDARQPDEALIDLSQSIGNQIGQYIQRCGVESELLIARERLEASVQSSGIGFWNGSLKTGAVYVTEQFANLLGFTAAEFPKEIAQFNDLVYPDLRKESIELFVAGVKTGKPFAQEVLLRHRDGSYRWYMGRAKAEIQADGKADLIAGSLVDIDERKKLDTAKDDFIGTVSHELKTPLTAIRGAIGLLDGGVAGPLSTDAKELTEMALAACERLSRLVSDTLLISRLEHQIAREGELIVVDSVLGKDRKLNQSFCDVYQVSLLHEYGAPDAVVKIHLAHLDQLLTNLISNAAKFSSAGGVVTVSTGREGGFVRIKVIDHGCGVPEVFRTRIFGKFQQADTTDGRVHEGSGLGLNIARMLAEKIGGHLDYFDTPGGGATFYLDLPEVTVVQTDFV